MQIAHNAKFDIGMIYHEVNHIFGEQGPLVFNNIYCIMELMTPICKLPYISNKSGYKYPKLEEAYNYLFPGETIPDQHNALQDCRATAKIFKYLWTEGFIKEKDLIDQ